MIKQEVEEIMFKNWRLDTEIKRVEIVNTSDKSYEARMMARLDVLIEVKNDLQGRLEEKYNGKFI